MSLRVNLVRQQLADAIEGGTTDVAKPRPPSVLVELPTSVTPDDTLSGTWVYEFPLLPMVSAADQTRGWERLQAQLDDITAVVDTIRTDEIDSATVTRIAEFGTADVGGTPYLTCTITVQVFA